MEKLDFFDLNSPADLYRIIHEVYSEYVKNPTEKDFFFLVLGFTHLREWISDSGYKEMVKKHGKGMPLSDSEEFFLKMYELDSFKTIQALCNRGKHHITRDIKNQTSKLNGLRAGLGRVGDSLNQTYFLIDGVDSRDYFIELLNKYNHWFSKHG